MKITLGSDPEYFISNGHSLVSAIPIWGQHVKEYPMPFGNGVSAYSDNVACEATIRPASSPDEYISSFRDMFGKVGSYLSSKGNFSLVPQAAHLFSNAELDNPEAQRFGCHPEFSAYQDADGDWMVFPPPDPQEIGNLRVCGGHIHIGRDDFKQVVVKEDTPLLSFASQLRIARMLDFTLGLALTYLDQDPTNITRKAVYGKPGSIRATPYGVEYRTLSNFWTHHPDIVGFVFELTTNAVKFACENPDFITTIPFDAVRNAILTSDRNTAMDIFRTSPFANSINEINSLDKIKYTGILQW